MKSEMKLVVVLLGPPGSGKGTQAKLLCQALSIPHISTGDLFRDHMKNDTPLGIKAKSYINSGKLVPDDLTLEMLAERIKSADCQKGFLLDGVPRTVPQAEALEESLFKNVNLHVLNLLVPDELIIKRAEGRLLCKQCGAIFNRYFSAPKKENICDNCGGSLYHRDDDNADVVKERLRVYNQQTKPLIDYFNTYHELINVNGNNSPEHVFEDLKKSILGQGCTKNT